MAQTRQLQALLDTYTYSTSDSLPAKTLKVRKIHSYNDLRNLPHPPFWIFLFILLLLLQLNWPTAKVAQVLSLVFTWNGPCVRDPRPRESSELYSQLYNRKFSLFVGSHFLCGHVHFTFHRKVGLKRAQVRGSTSRSGWGSREHKQVGITPRTEMDTVGTQEKLVKQV